MEPARGLGLAREAESDYQTTSKQATASQVTVPLRLFSPACCCQLGYGKRFALIELMCLFRDRCGHDKVRHSDGDEYGLDVDDQGDVEEYQWK